MPTQRIVLGEIHLLGSAHVLNIPSRADIGKRGSCALRSHVSVLENARLLQQLTVNRVELGELVSSGHCRKGRT